ncbi:MAG TPA: hypothetical protein VGP16_10295 [Asanoa sp.]|jgi:hypothetical protein|nr:hypothetical protein [Asanoa sp.]
MSSPAYSLDQIRQAQLAAPHSSNRGYGHQNEATSASPVAAVAAQPVAAV